MQMKERNVSRGLNICLYRISHDGYGRIPAGGMVLTALLLLLMASSVSAGTFWQYNQADPTKKDCHHYAEEDTEMAICSEPKLSARDDQIANLYHALLDYYRKNGFGTVESLPKAQRAWVGWRNFCGGDVECIEIAFDARKKQLCKQAHGDRLDLTGC
jgi:uncharacterized protein